jgi:DNA polymerase-3 subunit delta'
MAQSGKQAQQWATLPKALAQGRADAFDGFSGTELVGVMQKIAHDMWLVFAGAEPRFFAADDLPACRNVRALQDWTLELSRLARVAEHPFSAPLFLHVLVTHGQSAVNSRP